LIRLSGFIDSFSSLSVYQHVLLPFTGFLIGAMNAPSPATWALLTFEKFLYRSLDSPYTGLGLFGVLNPANKLVAGDRRQALPQARNVF